MKRQTLIVLGGIVIVLSSYLFFFQLEKPSLEDRAAAEKLVVRFDPDAVRRIGLDRVGAERIVLERAPARDSREPWWIVEPIDHPADSAQVGALIDSLESLGSGRELRGVDGFDVGLGTPRVTIVLELDSGEVLGLEIGAAVPGADRMVVHRTGERNAHIVEDDLFSQVDREPGAWRSRREPSAVSAEAP